MAQTKLDNDSLGLVILGVGIAAPSQVLDVRSTNGANMTVGRTSNVGVGSEPGSYFVTAPNASGNSRIWTSLRTIVNTPTEGAEASALTFNTQSAGALREAMRIDSVGGVGIGTANPAGRLHITTSPLWSAADGIVVSPSADGRTGMSLYYFIGSGVLAESMRMQPMSGGGVSFSVGSRAAIGSEALKEAMRVDASSNLLVGVTSGSTHTISKSSAEGASVLVVQGGGTYSFAAMAVSGVGVNSAATALSVMKNSTTSRSINAAGTINASGADYAEYMKKADECGVIEKGQIVGIDGDGRITDKWANAVSFLIKSTDPSYVGGDTWGSEEAIGVNRPTEPIFVPPTYAGAPHPDNCSAGLDLADYIDVAERAIEGMSADEAAPDAAYTAALAAYALDQTAHAEAVDAALELFNKTAMPAYHAALGDFNVKLEAARQRVDRMAYCGQVPCNVLGAQPGQYVVPVQDGESIAGRLADADKITFAEYLRAVGIVQNILPDGRANVRVKPV